MTAFRIFLRIAANRAIVTTALKLAVIVGLILNLINQGDLLVAADVAAVHWPKFFLTFCVPFCVSMYSATRAKMRFDPHTRALVDASLRCKSCGNARTEMRAGKIIEECPKCGDATAWSLDADGSL